MVDTDDWKLYRDRFVNKGDVNKVSHTSSYSMKPRGLYICNNLCTIEYMYYNSNVLLATYTHLHT
jgi:hypothetical protein